MKALFSNKYFIILLVVTVGLLAAMTIYTSEHDNVPVAEDLIGATLTPMQKLFSNITSNVMGFFSYFTDLNELREENNMLKEKIAQLESDARDLEMYKYENERFRIMLNFKEKLDYEILTAEIVAKDPGTWYNSFTIDKGSADGIMLDMAVVSELGLIGRIDRVGTNWAKVVSILEPDAAVGCLVQRTREIAVVESDNLLKEDGLLKMTYIQTGANVVVGDYLETSGLGGKYPKGLLIGQVIDITPDKTSINQLALVKPAANFEKITEVTVIMTTEIIVIDE